MTERKVYFSDALANPELFMPLTTDVSVADVDKAIALMEKNLMGHQIEKDLMPKAVFAKESVDRPVSQLPHIFLVGSFWCLSAECAEVLRQFDMGGSLHPVDVFQKDRKTPVAGDYFCINFGSVKDAFIPELSPNATENPFRQGDWYIGPFPSDGGIVVTKTVLGGADFWLDPGLRRGLFASERLVVAMHKAQVAKDFDWHSCRIVDEA